jgi:hypothetical protein
MNATYRAIEVPRPGEFSEVRKSLHTPVPIRYAFVLRHAASAIRIPQQSMEFSPVLLIRVSQATRLSGASMHLVQVSRVGHSVSELVSGFSVALAATANSAAAAIS